MCDSEGPQGEGVRVNLTIRSYTIRSYWSGGGSPGAHPNSQGESFVRTHLLTAASVAVLAFGAAPAFAQSDTADTTLDEIVVTAQRREERLRDVPQVASVLDGDALSKQGLNQLQDIAARTPGMSVGGLGGVGRQQINLRGITTGVDVNQTVGIYVDDVPYGSGTPTSGSAQLALEIGSFDVQRIEVLRGPQGTLYGASAFGGVLKYVLTPPSLDGFSGRIQAEGSGTDGGGFNWGLRGSVDATLVPEKLGVRITALNNHYDGAVDNVATGKKNVDSSDVSVGRFSFLAKPAEDLTLRGTFLAQDIDREGNTQVDYSIATGRPIYGDLKQNHPLADPFDQKLRIYSLGGDYDFGFATLTAAAGYQTVRTDYFSDSSALYVPLLGGLLGSVFGIFPDAAGVDGSYDTQKSTFEMRLASPQNKHFEWLVGAYYTEEDNHLYQRLRVFEAGVEPALDIGTFNIYGTVKELAGFANATYWLNDNLDVSAGVRLAKNEQTYFQLGSGLLASSNPGSSSEDTVATYLLAGRWHFSPDNMLYVRAASGYRPGGPNLTAVDPITGDPIGSSTFASDTLWNYEVGVKLKPLDWLSVEASAFYIDWKDIQLVTTANGLSVIGNGKGARSRGIEASFAAEPVRGLLFAGSAAIIDAELTDAAPDLYAADGERLPNVARFSSNLSVDKRFEVAGHPVSVGASWRYVGERRASFDGSPTAPQYVLPSFNSFDLRASVEFERFDLNAYVRNVSDERGQTGAYTGLAAAGGPSPVVIIQPRTFGLVATARF
jgi:iron complex outermembrane receptor protein